MSTKGCIIAANNSNTSDGQLLDYCDMAKIAAMYVDHHLGLPTTFITHQPENFDSDNVIVVPESTTNNRVMASNDQQLKFNWYNDLRIDAFYKSPYDRTLMIDADYIVNSKQLLTWIDSDLPFHTFNANYDVTGRKLDVKFKYLPTRSIRHVWATAMVWDKRAEPIFEVAKMVRDNYEFYAVLTGMPRRPFRNDLAFSIAKHLINYAIPEINTIANLVADSMILDITPSGTFKILQPAGTNEAKMILWHSDLHIIGKDLILNTEVRNKLRAHICEISKTNKVI